MTALEPKNPRTLPNVLFILALIFISGLSFWPGLSGGFIFDDTSSILGNPAIHVTNLNQESLYQAAFSFEPGGGSRPLSMLSFALNHVADGLNPWGYKLVNLMIHGINALLIFALALKLLALGGVEAKWRGWGAFALALAWAIHPLQVSSVMYVVQRMETLSLLFVLLALLSYLRGRENQIQGTTAWPWLVACIPLWALGVLSKESAALFPVYILAFELTVLGFRAHNPQSAKLWRTAFIAGSIAALVVFAFYYVPQHYSSGLIEGRNFSTPDRLLTQLRALTLYLGQILLPLPDSMTFYYDDFAVSKSLFSPPSTALSAVILLALLSSAVWARTRYPLYALGIFIFFAAHAITSNIIGLELVFEHRNYFALFGILLAVGDIVRRIPVRDGPFIKIAGVSAIILFLVILSTLRASIWGKQILLADDLVSLNPQSSRAWVNLGARYFELSAGDPESPLYHLAENAFEKAALLPNAPTIPLTNLMKLNIARGITPSDKMWEDLYKIIQEKTIGIETVSDLFGLLDRSNESALATLNDQNTIHALNLLLQRKPNQPAYRYAQLGDFALYHLGDETQAKVYFIEAIQRSEPDAPLPAQIINDLRQSNHHGLADDLGKVEHKPLP